MRRGRRPEREGRRRRRAEPEGGERAGTRTSRGSGTGGPGFGDGSPEVEAGTSSGRAMLALHVQPAARRTELAGLHGDAIKVRVAAPPVGGAANEELCRFLAARLGVAASAVRVARGAAARRKLVLVEGLTAEAARERLLTP